MRVPQAGPARAGVARHQDSPLGDPGKEIDRLHFELTVFGPSRSRSTRTLLVGFVALALGCRVPTLEQIAGKYHTLECF